MPKKLPVITIFLSIYLMLSCAHNVSLKDYKAKNQDEAAIVDVLQSLSDGWATKDKQPFLSSCHADARFMDKAGDYVTREDMIIQEVDDWGPPSKAWFGYYDLSIEINGDRANVNCIEKRDYGPTKATFIMVKDKQKWKVLKYDWLH